MNQEEKARQLAMEGTMQKLKERYVLLIRKVKQQKEEIGKLRAENEELKRQLHAADVDFSTATDMIFSTIHRNHQSAKELRPQKAGFRAG